MLTQLLALLEQRRGALNLYEISRALHAEPGAVQGMLEMLVQRGRLIEVGPDGGYCTTCGEQTQCSLLAARGKRYAAPPPAWKRPV
jgi:predicted transcriptional regulator